MIKLKYTKNLDKFIIKILSQLEIFLNENDEILYIYSNEYVCELIKMMFGENVIITQKIKNILDLPKGLIELDDFLDEYYSGISCTNLRLLPLNPQNNFFLQHKKYICIFPKFSAIEKYHTFTTQMLEDLIKKYNFDKLGYEIRIIGDVFEKINTKYGKDVKNFIDIISNLKYCNLFITSESYWKYIALLCNCRNIVVYNTNNDKKQEYIDFNPYNGNICTTNNLFDTNTCEFIKKIIV